MKTRFLREYRHSSAGWILSLAALIIWSLGLGLAALYIGATDYGRILFFSYFENRLIWQLNLIPVFFLTFTAFFVTNRVWSASLVSGLIILAGAVVNYFKVRFRSDPLVAEDIKYFFEAANMGQRYTFALTRSMIFSLAATIVFVLLSVFLFRARFTGESGFRIRVVCVVIMALAWTSVRYNYYRSEQLYDKTENMDVEGLAAPLSSWSIADVYVSRGFVYPFIYSMRDLEGIRPVGYSRQSAESMLYSYDYDDIPEEEKVTVIAVMLEAFCDLGDFGKFEYAVDPYAYFHELQKESVHGNLITNIFAGNTVDTERSFLTGSTAHFDYRAPVDSYVRYFRDQGYYTEFCHPGEYWFYNRRNISDYLGFHASYFKTDRYPPVREDWLVGDDIFMADIITLYEESMARGEHYFNFSVTYQNHGPYNTERLYASDEFVQNYGISLVSYYVINNYLSGIASTVDNIKKTVDYFREENEPVILLFFGDHKPWLGYNSAVYYELDFNIDKNTPEGFFNHYSAPYIIWANDAAKGILNNDFIGYGGDFSPAFLMTKLFDLAGWSGNEYIKLTREISDRTELIHTASETLVLESDVITDEPSPELEELLRRFEIVQYYRRSDMPFALEGIT